MKILLIHEGHGTLRGSEKVIKDLMDGLKYRGYEWLLMTNHSEFHDYIVASGYISELIVFNRLFVDSTSLIDLHKIIQCYRHLRKVITLYKPNVVHINNGGACQWAVPACVVEGIPSLVHLHAPWSRKMRFLLGLHQPDYIVGVSRAVLTCFNNDPVARTKLRVIYNGVRDLPTSITVPDVGQRCLLGIRPDQIVVGLFGALISGKRAMDAINAMRILAHEFGDHILLLVVGDGEEKRMLEEKSQGLPINYLGQCNDVNNLMNHVCDLIVLPSEIEAFSLVLLEAAICSLPRIASNAGGNIESIHHMEDGLIVPVGDAKAIAESIKIIMSDSQLAEQLGQRARQRALSEFSWMNFLNNFDILYEEINRNAKVTRINKIFRVLKSAFYQIVNR